MDSSFCKLISAFILFLFFPCQVQSLKFNSTGANKHSVKTIQIDDGSIIDCVPIHLQPAFDHPSLKGLKPITDPPEIPNGSTPSNYGEKFMVWRMDDASCPKNTIPIRRITEEDDVLRANRVRVIKKDSFDTSHEHAIAYVDGVFFGAEAIINLWLPKIENENEMSLSQIWVTSGSGSGRKNFNSIEAGWKVTYDDRHPIFFIFWTNDGYDSTGCYNLECPGFVQITKTIVLGVSAFNPVSSYNGPQYDFKISVWKDNDRWHLQVNDIYVGYWPSSIFTLLKDHATMIQYGGEIVNSGSWGRHTKTQMGSGHFPSEGYTRSSYIRNVRVVDSKRKMTPAKKQLGVYEKQSCYYTGSGSASKTWGTYIFYGGPGRDAPNCG